MNITYYCREDKSKFVCGRCLWKLKEQIAATSAFITDNPTLPQVPTMIGKEPPLTPPPDNSDAAKEPEQIALTSPGVPTHFRPARMDQSRIADYLDGASSPRHSPHHYATAESVQLTENSQKGVSTPPLLPATGTPVSEGDDCLQISMEKGMVIIARYKSDVTCHWWNKGIGCKEGEKHCHYAHSDTGTYIPTSKFGHTARKQWTCYDWLLGYPHDAAKCIYAHHDTSLHMGPGSLPSMKHITCYFWRTNKFCNHPDYSCRYAHEDTGVHVGAPGRPQLGATLRFVRENEERLDRLKDMIRDGERAVGERARQIPRSEPPTNTSNSEQYPQVFLRSGEMQIKPRSQAAFGACLISSMVGNNRADQGADQAYHVSATNEVPEHDQTGDRRFHVASHETFLDANSCGTVQAPQIARLGISVAELLHAAPPMPLKHTAKRTNIVLDPRKRKRNVEIQVPDAGVDLPNVAEDKSAERRSPSNHASVLLDGNSWLAPSMVAELAEAEEESHATTPKLPDFVKKCEKCLKNVFGDVKRCKGCADGFRRRTSLVLQSSPTVPETPDTSIEGLALEEAIQNADIILNTKTSPPLNETGRAYLLTTVANPLKRHLDADQVFVTNKRPKFSAPVFALRPTVPEAYDSSTLGSTPARGKPPTIGELIENERRSKQGSDDNPSPEPNTLDDVISESDLEGVNGVKESPVRASHSALQQELPVPVQAQIQASTSPRQQLTPLEPLDYYVQLSSQDENDNVRIPRGGEQADPSVETVQPEFHDVVARSGVQNSLDDQMVPNPEQGMHGTSLRLPIETATGTRHFFSSPSTMTCRSCRDKHKKCLHNEGETNLNPARCYRYMIERSWQPDSGRAKPENDTIRHLAKSYVETLPSLTLDKLINATVEPEQTMVGQAAREQPRGLHEARSSKDSPSEEELGTRVLSSSTMEPTRKKDSRPSFLELGDQASTHSLRSARMEQRAIAPNRWIGAQTIVSNSTSQPPVVKVWTENDERKAIAHLKKRGVMFEPDSDSDSDSDVKIGNEEESSLTTRRFGDPLQWSQRSRDLFQIAPELRPGHEKDVATDPLMRGLPRRMSRKEMWKNLSKDRCRERRLRTGNPHQEVNRNLPDRMVRTTIQQEVQSRHASLGPLQIPEMESKIVEITFREFIGMPEKPIVCKMGGKLSQDLAFRDGSKQKVRITDEDKFPFIKA